MTSHEYTIHFEDLMDLLTPSIDLSAHYLIAQPKLSGTQWSLLLLLGDSNHQPIDGPWIGWVPEGPCTYSDGLKPAGALQEFDRSMDSALIQIEDCLTTKTVLGQIQAQVSPTYFTIVLPDPLTTSLEPGTTRMAGANWRIWSSNGSGGVIILNLPASTSNCCPVIRPKP